MRSFCLLTVGVLLLLCCSGCAGGSGGGRVTSENVEQSQNVTEPDVSETAILGFDQIMENYLSYGMSTPFWNGGIMYNEIAIPFVRENGEAYASLLYLPTRILSVTDRKLETVFCEGKDYTVDYENGLLRIPDGSAIPTLSERVQYGENIPDGFQKADSGDKYDKYAIWNYGKGDFVYTESPLFYAFYLCVTYEYQVPAEADVFPTFDGAALKHIREKLTAGKNLNIAVFGDSITFGCSSSGDVLNTEPGTPSYINQMKTALERFSGTTCTVKNYAVSGSKCEYLLSTQGEAALTEAIEQKPDLVIIAYGMNDMTGNVQPERYYAVLESTIRKIRMDVPECDFLLINSFPCNSRYEKNEGKFDSYLEQLEKLQTKFGKSRCCVLDMQSVGNFLLSRKEYCEIASNNVNHPNDFMHRVYCMCVLTKLIDFTA